MSNSSSGCGGCGACGRWGRWNGTGHRRRNRRSDEKVLLGDRVEWYFDGLGIVASQPVLFAQARLVDVVRVGKDVRVKIVVGASWHKVGQRVDGIACQE